MNHYLIKMIDEILRSLDKNSVYEKFAVFCTMVDWRQAFDRQCLELGINSFIRNGVGGMELSQASGISMEGIHKVPFGGYLNISLNQTTIQTLSVLKRGLNL